MERAKRSTPMIWSADRAQEAAFRRMVRFKQPAVKNLEPLGADLVSFFKSDIQRKQTRFGLVAEVWQKLIPITLIEHTCLESLHAGTLKVLVDSSSHLYELKTVLLAGLQKQILLACRSAGLRKITLKLGRWYDGDDPRRITFQT